MKEFDMVIPVGPSDQGNLKTNIENIRKYVKTFRRIYLIPFCTTYIIHEVATNHGCTIVEESEFSKKISGMTKQAIADYFANTYPHQGKKKNRNGWYFQQLLKLYAGIVIPDILDTYLVIDADVRILKPVSFFSETKPLYETGTENHRPYFEHMQRMHPLFRKMQDPEISGICHHMMFETKYVKDMMQMVEDYHNQPFWKIFIESVEEHKNHPTEYEESGASEYEMYFHFMLQFHAQNIGVRKKDARLKWKNISKRTLLEENEEKELDYVSVCHYL